MQLVGVRLQRLGGNEEANVVRFGQLGGEGASLSVRIIIYNVFMIEDIAIINISSDGYLGFQAIDNGIEVVHDGRNVGGIGGIAWAFSSASARRLAE